MTVHLHAAADSCCISSSNVFFSHLLDVISGSFTTTQLSGAILHGPSSSQHALFPFFVLPFFCICCSFVPSTETSFRHSIEVGTVDHHWSAVVAAAAAASRVYLQPGTIESGPPGVTLSAFCHVQ